MASGDDIYLRGGNYGNLELTGSVSPGAGHVRIVTSKSGTSENWSSIQSYPGEWAVLDGENNCDYSSPNPFGSVLGMPYAGHDGAYDLSYWKFERLEIKNGASPDGTYASGIFVNGGPFYFRYLYVHDNIASTGGNNPGGITGYQWHDSLVEYCVFRDNGTNESEYEQHAMTGPMIFSDYQYDSTVWETAPVDINLALRKNEIRYCIFDNTENHYAAAGIHNKGRQYLGPKSADDNEWVFQEYGDKYHHNVFLNYKVAIQCQQDFQQIYNNIALITAANSNFSGISVVDITLSGNNIGVAIYNNTIINGRIPLNFGFGDTYVVNPYVYVYNNLLDQAPADYDGAGVISLGQPYMANPFVYDATRTNVDRNYFYRGTSNSIKVTRNADDGFGFLTPAEYNSYYSTTNYTKADSEASDALYESGYVTRGAHVITGATTIANGGMDTLHPYLTGVSIPAYVGATNPDDNEWVSGVMGLDVAHLTDAVSTPTWIESN